MTKNKKRSTEKLSSRDLWKNVALIMWFVAENGMYNKRGEVTMVFKLRNFFPSVFQVTAKGTEFEDVAYAASVELFLKLYDLGILPKECIFNLFQRKAAYNHELFVRAKLAVGVLAEEVGKGWFFGVLLGLV